MRKFLRDDPHARPLAILVACFLLLVAIDGGQGRFLTAATAFSTLQTFANFGLVALGLGLTMLIREFDLSVVGMFGLAGCIAVLAGESNPWLGLSLAVGVGVLAGVVQGAIIVRFRLGSVGVTLGGLLITAGIAYVVTENQAVPYDNLKVALAINDRIAGMFSYRSLAEIAVFAVVALVVGFTRLGRDMIAMGSDRRAASVAGVAVDRLIVGAFAFSGACAALTGAMLSYSLTSASPAGLSDVIVPSLAAAIVGGVSLGGGSGRPLGIALGVLVLAVLRSGLNAVGGAPWLNDVAMGAVLFIVAILDGPDLARRLAWRRPAE